MHPLVGGGLGVSQRRRTTKILSVGVTATDAESPRHKGPKRLLARSAKLPVSIASSRPQHNRNGKKIGVVTCFITCTCVDVFGRLPARPVAPGLGTVPAASRRPLSVTRPSASTVRGRLWPVAEDETAPLEKGCRGCPPLCACLPTPHTRADRRSHESGETYGRRLSTAPPCSWERLRTVIAAPCLGSTTQSRRRKERGSSSARSRCSSDRAASTSSSRAWILSDVPHDYAPSVVGGSAEDAKHMAQRPFAVPLAEEFPCRTGFRQVAAFGSVPQADHAPHQPRPGRKLLDALLAPVLKVVACRRAYPNPARSPIAVPDTSSFSTQDGKTTVGKTAASTNVVAEEDSHNIDLENSTGTPSQETDLKG